MGPTRARNWCRAWQDPAPPAMSHRLLADVARCTSDVPVCEGCCADGPKFTPSAGGRWHRGTDVSFVARGRDLHRPKSQSGPGNSDVIRKGYWSGASKTRNLGRFGLKTRTKKAPKRVQKYSASRPGSSRSTCSPLLDWTKFDHLLTAVGNSSGRKLINFGAVGHMQKRSNFGPKRVKKVEAKSSTSAPRVTVASSGAFLDGLWDLCSALFFEGPNIPSIVPGQANSMYHVCLSIFCDASRVQYLRVQGIAMLGHLCPKAGQLRSNPPHRPHRANFRGPRPK